MSGIIVLRLFFVGSVTLLVVLLPGIILADAAANAADPVEVPPAEAPIEPVVPLAAMGIALTTLMATAMVLRAQVRNPRR